MRIFVRFNYELIINHSECPFNVVADGLKHNDIGIKDTAIRNKIKTQGNE